MAANRSYYTDRRDELARQRRQGVSFHPAATGDALSRARGAEPRDVVGRGCFARLRVAATNQIVLVVSKAGL